MLTVLSLLMLNTYTPVPEPPPPPPTVKQQYQGPVVWKPAQQTIKEYYAAERANKNQSKEK